MTFSNFLKRALIVSTVAFVALPAVAFEPGLVAGGDGPDTPDLGGPDGFAPNPPGGGGGGGGGSAQNPQGGGYIANSFNECPNGEMVVNYDVDSDGHPIPASFERSCVVRR